MRRKASRKRAVEITYCIEITMYEPSYMFSLATNPDIDPGPYWEHAEIEMEGVIVHPEHLKGRQLRLVLLGDRDKVPVMEHPETCRWEPKAVGRLNLRGKTSEFLGSVPFDGLIFVSYLIESGRSKFLILSAESLYHGSAAVRSIRFSKDYGPDDWG